MKRKVGRSALVHRAAQQAAKNRKLTEEKPAGGNGRQGEATMAEEIHRETFRFTWHSVTDRHFNVLGCNHDDAEMTFSQFMAGVKVPEGWVTEITDDVRALKTQILTHRPMVNGAYAEVPVTYYLCSKCKGTHLMTPEHVRNTEGLELTEEQREQFNQYSDRVEEIEAAILEKVTRL